MPDLDWQYVAGGLCNAAVEDADKAFAFSWIFEFVGLGRGADGQLLLHEDEVGGVFVRGNGAVAGQAQLLAQGCGEGFRLGDGRFLVRLFASDQVEVFPDRLAVGAPVDGEGPAGELLAGIPFALAVVEHGSWGKTLLEAAKEFLGVGALIGADGSGIPFGAFHVVGGNEGRLAPHREADVAALQEVVNVCAAVEDGLPSLVAVGQCHPGRFADAGQRHLEVEGHLGLFVGTRDGGGTDGMRGGSQRDVALAGEQAGRGVEADPAGAREVDFGPGVEVGEVGFSPNRAVERFDVGGELDQVAGHEAGGEAQIAEDLDEQPGAVAAGAGLFR